MSKRLKTGFWTPFFLLVTIPAIALITEAKKK